MTSAGAAQTRSVALIVACAMFMAQFDASVVQLAMPAMAASFAVRPLDLTIGIAIYLLAQAALLPASGWIADRFGARRVLAAALLGFTAASVLCGLSQTLDQFIAARVLQGGAAALMTPVARIVLLRSTQKSDLVRAMTIASVPMLLAPTLGPPLGGLITTYLSWPWIFYLNLPFGILGFALVLRYIPELGPAVRRPFDIMGFLLLGSAIAVVLAGLEQASMDLGAWLAGLLLVALGLLLGWLAVRHLWRHPHPVISLLPTRIHTYFVTSIGGGGLVRLPARAVTFVLPLLFQIELGYDAVQTGFMLLAMSGGDLVLKSVTSPTLRRFGFRSVLIVSASTLTITIAACALLAGLLPFWGIIVLLCITGMARSLLFTGMSSLTFADVPSEQVGSASVLWNLTQQVTNALGVALAALFLNIAARLAGDPAGHINLQNCQAALLLMAFIGGLSLLSFLRLPRGAGAGVSGHGPIP